jgi:hypothetical protein
MKLKRLSGVIFALSVLLPLAAFGDQPSDVTVRKIGNYTLRIPPGYIHSMDGYQNSFGYIRIRALLPCLQPETTENTAEFHKNTLGHIIDVRLSQ